MNQLAFSTLGCPAWDLDRIIHAALDYGYDALEWRGYLADVDLTQAEPFLVGNLAETRRRLDEAGLKSACVSSSGVVAKGNTDHVKSHVEIARALDCPFVRVFGGAAADGETRADASPRFAENLRVFADAAQDAGVQIVLETHDDFSTGVHVAELLALTDHPAARSLWDLHHPFRQGEAPEGTLRALAPTLAYVHVKDGLPPDSYTLMGSGDIPIPAMLALLRAHGYAGPVSVEWETRWKPEIAAPEIALPQYATALRRVLAEVKGSLDFR